MEVERIMGFESRDIFQIRGQRPNKMMYVVAEGMPAIGIAVDQVITYDRKLEREILQDNADLRLNLSIPKGACLLPGTYLGSLDENTDRRISNGEIMTQDDIKYVKSILSKTSQKEKVA